LLSQILSICSWKIEGRLSNKSNIRTFSNKNASGTVLTFTVCDHSGEIRVTAFGEPSIKFFPMLHNGLVCTYLYDNTDFFVFQDLSNFKCHS
jgi:hypothetical protein